MLWEKKPQAATPPERPLPAPVVPPDISELEKPEKPMTDIAPRTTPVAGTQPSSTLGRSVVIKGELVGKEDLMIEGQFEGTIDVAEHTVTVGAQGQVKSEIRARQVVVHGSVAGKITAREKIEIRRTGNVVGDLVAAGVAIEDGAYFKGSIEILREGRAETQKAQAATAQVTHATPAMQAARGDRS